MAGLKFRRGLKTDLPTLAAGEPGFCTDTYELFIGSAGGNKNIPASSVRFYGYSASTADDASVTLPTHALTGHGFVIAGNNVETAEFYLTTDGTVTLVYNSDNVVANANTDANLCIGTAVQTPLLIKNRLGSPSVLTIVFWYV